MAHFKSITIKQRLILSFLIILLVPTITIGILSYVNTKEQISQQQLASAHQSLNLLNDNLTAIIEPKIEQVSFLSTYINEQHILQDEQFIRTLLSEYLAMHTDAAIAYIGTKDGDMIREPYFEYAADYDPRKRPWYTEATEKSGQMIITAPYISTSSGEMVVTIAKQLSDKSGVFGIDVSIQTIINIANSVTIGNEGFVSIVDETNHYIANPTIESGTEATDTYVTELTEEGEAKVFGEHTITYEKNKLTGWKLYGNALNQEATDAANNALIATIVVIIICIILGVVLSYYTIRSILRPVRLLGESATAISEGDLTKKIPALANDEIGQLGQKFEVMQQSLVNLVGHVHISATNVQSSANVLHNNANETVNATELASASIQQIAATLDTQMAVNEKNAQTMHVMESDITAIAANSQEIAGLSQEVLATATDGTKSVQRTVQQMDHIAHSVTAADETVQSLSSRVLEINSIVDVISEIANQTNLLALNASIEAARAGVHGQGFAVVAQEVGKLAASSQASALQIGELVSTIEKDTSQSVHYMSSVKQSVQQGLAMTDETAQQFTRIVASLEQVTPMIEHISTNSEQLASSAEEATTAAIELSSQSQENTAAVEEIAAITEQIHQSMKEIEDATNSLQQLSSNLNNEVSRFSI